MHHDEFLRFNTLARITGLSRSTIWRLERAGKFPTRRQLAINAVGWLRSEVEEWMSKRHAASYKRAAP